MDFRRLKPVHEAASCCWRWRGIAGVVTSLLILWWPAIITPKVQWTLTIVIVLGLVGIRGRGAGARRFAAADAGQSARSDARRRLFDSRARRRRDDALGDVMAQVNAMGATLRAQRLGALEATTLLRKVMEEIDVAIFAFDGGSQTAAGESRRRAAARAAGGAHVERRGRTRWAWRNIWKATKRRTCSAPSRPAAGRWGIHRAMFREGGLPHQLLVVTDLTRALREEELQAWQRLVRVLGHELNNSLAPIKSIAGSLETLVARDPLPGDWREDTQRGLSIIAARSEGLSRFLGAYARLAKLPRPQLAPVDVGAVDPASRGAGAAHRPPSSSPALR